MVRVSRRVEKNHLAIVVDSQCYASSQIRNAHLKSDTQPSPHLRRIENKSHACIGKRTSTLHCGTQERTHNAMGYYPITQNTMATFNEKHCRRPDRTTALTVQTFTLAYNNLAKRNWFHSLPSWRFQALLTLFPKYFSSFPHGTCLLSVSNQYLALEENYLPFCTPRPKCATLRSPSVCPDLST